MGVVADVRGEVMPYPVRTALIVPSDAEPWAAHVAPLVRKSIEVCRDWLIAETGYGFDFEFTEHRSQKPRAWFHERNGVIDTDPCGDMVHEGSAWWVVENELKWPKWEGGVRRGDMELRHAVTVIHGGGVALGRATPWDHYDRTLYTFEQTGDYGHALYGDWDWRYLVTGLNNACMGPYGSARFADARTKRISPSFNHELMHMFNTDCHNPVLWPGLENHHMTAAHKEQFVKYNAAFIRKVGSVVVPELPPEPEPIPPPVVNPFTVTPESAILHKYFGIRSQTVTANKPITQVKSFNTSIATVTQTGEYTAKITRVLSAALPKGTTWNKGGALTPVAIVSGTERVFVGCLVRY